MNLIYDSKLKNRTINACRKGKNAYFALKGVMSRATNPSVLIKLYKTVVLQSVLYGCKTWSNLKSCDITTLTCFQHFIVKHMLALKTSTKSDMCESIIGIQPIMSFIHKRKLFFFLQKLCMLDNNNCLSKRIFLVRLFLFLIDPHRRHYGYIPDVIDMLRTYGLIQYLTEYIDTGRFPSKNQWKSIVHKTVNEQQSVNWLNRIALDDNFIRFRNIRKAVSMTNF